MPRIALLILGAIVGAIAVWLAVGLPDPPPQVVPNPLPWDETVDYERLPAGSEPTAGPDIFYARPKDHWKQHICEHREVLIPDEPIPTEPISAEELEGVASEQGELVVEGGVMPVSRCYCGYRVVWECTRVSRYIGPTLTMGDTLHVRYGFNRKVWEEDRVLRKRLSTMFVNCETDDMCQGPCEDYKPPPTEWGVQCDGQPPHRLLGRSYEF